MRLINFIDPNFTYMITTAGKRLLILLCPLIVLLICCKSNAGQKASPLPKTASYEKRLDSTVLVNDLAYLSSATLEGRETGSPGNAKAREFIIHRFDSLGLQKADTSWLQPFPLGQRSGNNVIGMVRGTDFPDRYYVLSAHYDHLGKRGNQTFFGADDNASGTACLLALAGWFSRHPPKHTLIIVAFDAEEKGLLGSRYFVDHSPVDLKKILLNINMDMVSRNDKNEIYLAGTYHYPFLKKYADSIHQKTAVNVLLGHDGAMGAGEDWTNQSDQGPFHGKNIPFMYFGVEDHPDYHKPSDTFDKVDKSFYYQVCNMIAEMVLLTDRQEKL